MLDVVSNQKSPDQLDVALGAAVRLRRRTLGMSQEGLAERCNVSFQQIQKYENGTNRISFSRLVQIATALKCRVNELVEVLDGMEAIDGAGPRDLGVHARLAIPGAMDVLAAYEAMTPQTRAHLAGLMRALTEA
jgi:transcriptional regulator with XRE-family HTH domain